MFIHSTMSTCTLQNNLSESPPIAYIRLQICLEFVSKYLSPTLKVKCTFFSEPTYLQIHTKNQLCNNTTLYFVNHYCFFFYTNITGQMLSEDFSKRCRVRDVVARIMVYYYGQLFISKYVIKHFLALLGKNRMGCNLYGQFGRM